MQTDDPHLPSEDPALDPPPDPSVEPVLVPDSVPEVARPALGWLLLRRAVVVVLLLAAAVAVAGLLRATRPQVASRPPESVRPVVETFAAQRVAVARQWNGRGTARALRSADVPARVTAVVEERFAGVRAGATVTQGQPLVRLDDEDFVRRAEVARQRIGELDAALAQLDVEQSRLREQTALDDSDVGMARTEFDRQTRLNDRGVTTEQDVDAARRILIAAQRSQLSTGQAADLVGPRRRQLEAQKEGQLAQEQLAELDRERTVITSPLTGVVQTLDVEVGDAVTLRSAAVGPLRPAWTSTVARVAPEQDTTTRTLTVFVEIAQTPGGPPPPPPGVFLNASVQTADVQPRWLVPRRALRDQRLQVVVNGKLASRATRVDYTLSGPRPELGVADDQWAVIDDDALQAGDRVLIDAANRLPEGSEVVDATGEAAE